MICAGAAPASPNHPRSPGPGGSERRRSKHSAAPPSGKPQLFRRWGFLSPTNGPTDSIDFRTESRSIQVQVQVYPRRRRAYTAVAGRKLTLEIEGLISLTSYSTLSPARSKPASKAYRPWIMRQPATGAQRTARGVSMEILLQEVHG